jgi:hypothetical protein
MPNNASAAIPSWTPIYPQSKESLGFKSKMGAVQELPGIIYNQYTPTAANCNTGTVTNNGASMIGANQLGVVQSGVAPLGGLTIVTASSNSGLLITISTGAAWLPTTANYNNMPVTFSVNSTGVLPTGLTVGQVYYWQWVSSTTGRLALVPNGTVIAYTDAGTATFYMNAATQYWGSPILPAGFLAAAEGIGNPQFNTSAFPGVRIHGEIGGSFTSAGTGNIQMAAGLLSANATWNIVTGAAANVAVGAVGPFPFWYTFDFIIQQYGPANLNSTTYAAYNNTGLIRGCGRLVLAQAATSGTADVTTTNIWGSSSAIDLTLQYTVDARCLIGSPATGTYLEPLYANIWVYN